MDRRLGRLLGVHGKTVQDYGVPTLLSIGIEERTGLLIHGSVARVMGVGSVDFVQQSADTVLRREVDVQVFDVEQAFRHQRPI